MRRAAVGALRRPRLRSAMARRVGRMPAFSRSFRIEDTAMLRYVPSSS